MELWLMRIEHPQNEWYRGSIDTRVYNRLDLLKKALKSEWRIGSQWEVGEEQKMRYTGFRINLENLTLEPFDLRLVVQH
jgi:hypothetical protein